ncbi:hypothetical protein TNCV_4944831 [Trichonephila clavipes]|nr:hypothetical protein TNCV_4944831 [Trichonephila clavipes]
MRDHQICFQLSTLVHRWMTTPASSTASIDRPSIDTRRTRSIELPTTKDGEDSDCKDLLPAPGNRSNETHDIGKRTWQRERRKAKRGENGERWREKRGRIKERRRDDGL